MAKAIIHIGTSGWHYPDWLGLFYPPSVTGYRELTFYAEHYDTVENNSSFYRISKESTYKTWGRMTPDPFVFSLKLNKEITHVQKLAVNGITREKVSYILSTTQVLRQKLGAIVIQLPASFKYDLATLEDFLCYFCGEVGALEYKPDIAIEFRNKYWFTGDLFALLKKYNVALVAAQSSRYPGAREITADICYIRLHGPGKLFASPYSDEELSQWAAYIAKAAKKVKRVYVYFNNDYHGYALANARKLRELLSDR